MDFIVKLLLLKEPITGTIYNSVWVIVDKLTKYTYFISYKEVSIVEDIVYVFLRTVVS